MRGAWIRVFRHLESNMCLPVAIKCHTEKEKDFMITLSVWPSLLQKKSVKFCCVAQKRIYKY